MDQPHLTMKGRWSQPLPTLFLLEPPRQEVPNKDWATARKRAKIRRHRLLQESQEVRQWLLGIPPVFGDNFAYYLQDSPRARSDLVRFRDSLRAHQQATFLALVPWSGDLLRVVSRLAKTC